MPELIKTGTPGLDQVLKGGLRKNSCVLVTGAPGTGKTLMALQFVYYGARDFNENGIFITTEESLEVLHQSGKNLGMDLQAMVSAGKIFILQKRLSSICRI